MSSQESDSDHQTSGCLWAFVIASVLLGLILYPRAPEPAPTSPTPAPLAPVPVAAKTLLYFHGEG